MTQYLVITGGVLSGLGKGVATASIARLLRDNRKIVTVKCDGYLNVDPGTMNPVEHGEVFVLNDGGEVDMDFGHYERFIGITCKSKWNLTSGKIFSRVIAKEREGKYLGKTIQIYPHVVDEVKHWWREVVDEEQPDLLCIEVGGTVGDDENAWFIEAARQLKHDVGEENVAYVHLTYFPFLDSVGEVKTKAAQRDLALLREKGIFPDVIVCRSKDPVSPAIKQKIARMCSLDASQIISGHDVDNIYEIPLMYEQEGLAKRIANKLNLPMTDAMQNWKALVQRIKQPEKTVNIAICGKYTVLKDSYASIIEALTHAGAHCNAHVQLKWIETTDIEKGILPEEALKGIHGVLVPGGFGVRGIEGKIAIIKHARENNIPYLGICYGLQLAVIEVARHLCGLRDANTTEVEPNTPHPVIDYLPGQRDVTAKGGTMRLGAYEAELTSGSLVCELYQQPRACERHRHRYEVNPQYHAPLREHLNLSGTSQNKELVEFIELTHHPYFVATQAHNELTSSLEKPNPLFLGFISAAMRNI